jgi:hypothetical protein
VAVGAERILFVYEASCLGFGLYDELTAAGIDYRVLALRGRRAPSVTLGARVSYNPAMQSKATTVAAYLKELPADRRAAIEAIRKVILANLDEGIEEGILYGMIGYYIPHSIYPAGYHCDPKLPLGYCCLASQKNYLSLYLMSVYCGCDGGDATAHTNWFREAWLATGKKLDMGKSCIRFKKLEDVPLEVIGEAIRRVPVVAYLRYYEDARKQVAERTTKGPPGRKKPAKKKASKKVAPKKAKARAK